MHAATLVHNSLPVIDIAKTVEGVANLTNPYAAAIVDRTATIDEAFVRRIVAQSVFSWEGRKPRPALDQDFAFQGTDLDLLSFMVPLVARGAVIELPSYHNRRPTTRKRTERRVGTSRFGKATGLISNQDVFSFSVRAFDQSVVTRDETTEAETTGAYRNFMLVDVDGTWHNGWKKIVFDPTRAENAFLTERGLLTGNAVYFTNYVHPNRRQSIFGAPYLLLKLLSVRLSDEAGYYRREMKRLESLGYQLPAGEKGAYVPTTKGAGKRIKVDTIETVFDAPNFSGWYPMVEESTEGLVQAYRWQKLLTYTLKPLVQFVVRADEAAYFKYGYQERYVASWIKGATWEDGYKAPRGRTTWRRLVLSPQCALRVRVKQVTQEVAANS